MYNVAIFGDRGLRLSRATYIGPPKSIMEPRASPTRPPFNPLVSMRDCKHEVEFRLNEIRKTLANEPISTSELQAKIDDADIAWIGFDTHHR